MPAPASAGCANQDPPYKVGLDGLSIVVVDTHAADDRKDDVVTRYRGDFAAMFKDLAAPAWLVMHRPVLGVGRDKNERLAAGEPTLLAALKDQIPASLQLQLSGHIHLFEALNYSGGLPPQLVVGNGGSAKEFAAPLPADLAAATLPARDDGFAIAPGSLPNATFGYVVMTRDRQDRANWAIALKDRTGRRILACAFAPPTDGARRALSCRSAA